MDIEQTLMRWGEGGLLAGAIIGRVPGATIAAYDDRHVVLEANGEPLAVLRSADDSSILVECDVPYEIRESLMAAGLAAYLPDGELITWHIPPEPVDTAIAILRAKRDAL